LTQPFVLNTRQEYDQRVVETTAINGLGKMLLRYRTYL